jgi:hypothetical protein
VRKRALPPVSSMSRGSDGAAHNHRRGLIVAWLLVIASPMAHAFVDAPILVPVHVTAGQPVSVSITMGVCDAVTEEPGFPQITVAGNGIRLLVSSVNAASDPVFCFFDTITRVISIGSFPAGNYTVQVDRQYEGSLGQTVIETLGILPLVVQRTGLTVSAPMLGPGVLLLLAVLVLLVAPRSIRRVPAAAIPQRPSSMPRSH